MGCATCDGQPKNTSKGFTKAVIEINNPEQLVLLRKVVIPASMGTEEDVPAAIGKYRNVVLQYEANNHIYLYSSDGIPTPIEANVPQEVLDRIADLETETALLETSLAVETDARERADQGLQQEIDDLKNSPDVVDIVATYADLLAYDTTSLGNKDIIRVLRDETHDGESSYYRWDKPHTTWTFIGTVGDYYTKAQTDNLLNAKQNTLTAGNNISISNDTISATDTTYSAGSGLNLNGTTFSVDTTTIQPKLTAGTNVSILNNTISATDTTYTAGTNVQISSGNVISATDTTYSAGSGLDLTGTEFSVDTTTIQPKLTAGSNITIGSNNEISATDTTYSNFVGTDGTAAGTAGLVPAPATTDAGKFLKADGTWDTAGSAINVVQTTGTSTTDVMSQNAVTSMVYADPATRNKLQLGKDATNMASNSGAAIGSNAFVASGTNHALAVGYNTAARATNSVALGSQSSAAAQGEMSIGNPTRTDLYNNTGYRLLTNVYDGQSAHDAATYGQVISYSAINGAGAPTTATEGRYVGQLYYDTTNEAMYFLKTIDTTTTPATYTWEALGGGGSSVNVVQTTGTSTTDVMSQNAVTSMVFADPSTMLKVQIGTGAGATGTVATAVGRSAAASGRGAIALGAGANASVQGQFDVSATNSANNGYNSSNYRLLTGLYDPQSDHDAATKGYVDSVAPVITMTTTDPGEGVALAENHFIAVYSAS